MNTPKNETLRIVDWFTEFYDMYDLPPPDNYDSIFNTIESEIGVIPTKVLGSGDYGIAILTNKGTVLKFTADKEEAQLWNNVKELEETIPAMLRCYAVYHLATSNNGELPLYLIHLEFAPYALPDRLKTVIHGLAGEARAEKMAEQHRIAQAHGQQEANRYSRALWARSYEKVYRRASNKFPELAPVVNLIRTLSKKHGMVSFDLHAGNFMMNKNKEIVLVDPSCPSFRHAQEDPQILMIEQIDLAIDLSLIPTLWI